MHCRFLFFTNIKLTTWIAEMLVGLDDNNWFARSKRLLPAVSVFVHSRNKHNLNKKGTQWECTNLSRSIHNILSFNIKHLTFMQGVRFSQQCRYGFRYSGTWHHVTGQSAFDPEEDNILPSYSRVKMSETFVTDDLMTKRHMPGDCNPRAHLISSNSLWVVDIQASCCSSEIQHYT